MTSEPMRGQIRVDAPLNPYRVFILACVMLIGVAMQALEILAVLWALIQSAKEHIAGYPGGRS